jgi:choline dehydrogenase-like flavoprotein
VYQEYERAVCDERWRPSDGVLQGRLRLNFDPASEEWPEKVKPSGHHIGTTRMHEDVRQGVVDAQCRVHTVSNLFVAGSSVFPTSGCNNPTLTIVALALRLADHLKANGLRN